MVGVLAFPGRLVLDRVGGGSCVMPCVVDLRSSLTRLDSWERGENLLLIVRGKHQNKTRRECPAALVRFNENNLKQLVLDCNGRMRAQIFLMRETVRLNSCSSGHDLVKASNVQM